MQIDDDDPLFSNEARSEQDYNTMIADWDKVDEWPDEEELIAQMAAATAEYQKYLAEAGLTEEQHQEQIDAYLDSLD